MTPKTKDKARRKRPSERPASEQQADAELDDNEQADVDPEIEAGDVDERYADGDDAFVERLPKQTQSLAKTDALAVYMREVQRHRLLSADEQHELAVRYAETGDVDAAAQLVTANLRLVVKIAYEYRRAYRNMMDLIQEGNIGLMQAVKKYDPYRGVKLSSYSAWWIRAYMLRFILNNWRMVKIGTTQAQRKLFFNLNKEKEKLSAMGITPTHREIAKRLNVEESEVIEMDRRLSRSDTSLDATVGDAEGKVTTRMDLLPAVGTAPDEAAAGAELHGLLREHLEQFRQTLKGKDIEIFDKRLVSDEAVTLQELGDKFGISRERVRQLEARLAGKLRTYLEDKLGDAV